MYNERVWVIRRYMYGLYMYKDRVWHFKAPDSVPYCATKGSAPVCIQHKKHNAPVLLHGCHAGVLTSLYMYMGWSHMNFISLDTCSWDTECIIHTLATAAYCKN